jgi:uncharacterized spore protein YtfJ
MGERASRTRRRRTYRIAVIGLLLLMVGCAAGAGNDASDNTHSGGFYGGLAAGGSGLP